MSSLVVLASRNLEVFTTLSLTTGVSEREIVMYNVDTYWSLKRQGLGALVRFAFFALWVSLADGKVMRYPIVSVSGGSLRVHDEETRADSPRFQTDDSHTL